MAGRRRRVTKKDVVLEVEDADQPVMKRGRRRKGDLREEQTTAKIAQGKKEESETEEEMMVKQEVKVEVNIAASSTTLKRKRGKGKQKIEALENKDVHQMNVKQEAVEEEEEEEEKEGALPTSTKRKEGRQPGKSQHKTSKKQEKKDEVFSPQIEKGKGKKGAAEDTKVKEEEEDVDIPTLSLRGKRAAAKAMKKEKEDEVKVPKRGKRVAANLIRLKEEEDEEISLVIRKGRKGTAKNSKAEVEDEEEDDLSPSKKMRGAVHATKKKQEKAAPKSKKSKNNPKKGKLDDQSTRPEEEDTSSAKVSGGRNPKASGEKWKKGVAKATKAEGKENTDTSNLSSKSSVKTGVERVMVVKGQAAVDALCPIAQKSHVYSDTSGIWDCMLNQTNIQFNNNKYYLIQLLEDDTSKTYSVWMRWGRVGANGQNSLQPCGSDLAKAMKIFAKKFSDKTKNEWELRDMFEKVPGKYDLLKMDYSQGTDTTDIAVKKAKEKVAVESKLHPRVRVIIELICDVKVMEEAVVEMKYDAKKAPLGKLTCDQIKAGYLALKRIDDLVQLGKYSTQELVHACNDFYTRVPHYFGMKVPPLIRTKAEIREKVALLEALGDIQAALSVLDQPIDVNTHPVDHHYHSLKCDMTAVDKDSDEYKIIEKYMQTTHAKTHSQYTLKLVELVACHKESEYKRFKDVGNRMLLWHGSRMSNWAGILSQGLRIAPPEAPSTGYMFGKGIYFADMVSKSANYCWANERNNTGFLLLSEVALGKSNELLHADYKAGSLPQGCHSVKGCGRTAPNPVNFAKLSDGTVVPLGPGLQTSPKNATNYSLLYNEYIIYNPAQARTRFLLKVQFNFK